MSEHIKIPDTVPIVRYIADGTQTVFVYPFPIFASEDIAVYLDGAKQTFGFTVEDAGQTAGGTITFATGPEDTSIVTLERNLAIERMTDYLEGGDFSAQSINNELDYIVASLQQVQRENDLMLKYGDHETPANVELPSKTQRANKALGFDASGNPIAVSLEGSMAAPTFTAQGIGATTRTSTDKFADITSIKDFGAVGDGLTDDTLAIQKALTAHQSVLIPEGTYLVTNTLTLATGQSLIGTGQGAVIKAQSNAFNTIEIPVGYTIIENIRIEGGDTAVKLYGATSECVQNNVRNVHIVGANIGLLLDGYDDTNKPCYWNNFANILIEQPQIHGVHLTKTSTGDTPNANRFHAVRVYSKSAPTSGSGFYIEAGSYNNSFIDCEANVNGPTADSCFRVGAGSNKTMLLNLLCESTNTVPNVKIDAGAVETSIINLSAESDGTAILDNSGGDYDALNAGYPEKNRLRKTVVTDLKATLMRYDTEFIDTAGTHTIDLSHSMHIVNATNGAIAIILPAASSAVGAEITVKKVDNTANIVTITEDGGSGADGKTIQLGGANDYATMISNGAVWYIKSSNRMSGNTRYHDGSGTYDVDMAVDTYIVSSFGGVLTMRLPPANASEAIGRTITIKKTDPSANHVQVTEQGGAGADQSTQTLTAQYQAITVLSNGGQWYVVSKY